MEPAKMEKKKTCLELGTWDKLCAVCSLSQTAYCRQARNAKCGTISDTILPVPCSLAPPGTLGTLPTRARERSPRRIYGEKRQKISSGILCLWHRSNKHAKEVAATRFPIPSVKYSTLAQQQQVCLWDQTYYSVPVLSYILRFVPVELGGDAESRRPHPVLDPHPDA